MDAEAGPTDWAAGGARALEAFGGVLRRERLAAGLTQEALAERAGLGVRTVQGLEEGEGQPRGTTARRLAQALALAGAPRARFEAAARPAPRRPARGLRLVPSAAAADLPPGRGPGARLTNLPLPRTSFVGREGEVAELTRLLAPAGGGPRLLTLTGPGGCGKTRLALEAAAGLLDPAGGPADPPYPDGVRLVDLTPLADGALVPRAALAAVRGRQGPGRPPLEALVAHLRPRAVLLVLDNCEHLLASCAEVVEALLGACPGVRLLATSREPLGVAGETAWPVPPLPLPVPALPVPAPGGAGSALAPDPADLAQYAAVRLFVERAAAVRPGFALTAGNAAAVAAVCARLDGLPLAIELAAARVRVLPPEQLLARLEDRFRLLTGGGRGAPPRQQTLRATVEWSYALLSEAERRLFGRLSVFAGGWTLEAAEAVGAGDGLPEAEVLDGLTRLVDQSLVVAEEAADGTARFRLLETLRQYAQERLAASGEEPVARARHGDYFLRLLRARVPAGREPVPGLARLVPEQANLRTALTWGLVADPSAGLELAVGVASVWAWQGHHQEACGWLEAALAEAPTAASADPARPAPAPAADTLRARALSWHGRLLRQLGETGRARAPATESLALFRRAGDGAGTSLALHNLGLLARAEGRPEEARRHFEEALAAGRRAGAADREAAALRDLGLLWFSLGDLRRAAALSAEAVALARRTDPRYGGGGAAVLLGVIAHQEGDPPRARRLLEAALRDLRGVGFRWGTYLALAALGDLAAAEGDVGAARARYRRIVAEAPAGGFDAGWQLGLVGLGLLAGRGGDHARAARLLGALTSADLTHLRVHVPNYVAPVEAALAASRAALGGDAFEASVAAARDRLLTELAADALEDAAAPG